MLHGQRQKIPDFIIVDAAHQHRVQLQALESGVLRRFHSLQDLIQRSLPGDLPKPFRLQRVQTDIQAVYPSLPQGLRQLRQEAAVGGQA